MSRSKRPNKHAKPKCSVCGRRVTSVAGNGRCAAGLAALGCFANKRVAMFERKQRLGAQEHHAKPLRKRGHHAPTKQDLANVGLFTNWLKKQVEEKP